MNTENTVVIYSLSDPRTGEVRYVGKTFSVKCRLKGHIHDKAITHKTNWIASLLRDGIKPEIRVLTTFIDAPESAWQKCEAKWIRKFRKAGFRLTNLASGGKGGGRHSEESKAKISAANKGRKRSAEVRARMSEQRKGKKVPPFTSEHLKNLGLSHLGAKASPEARAKMSAARKGKSTGPKSESHKAALRAASAAMSQESRDRIVAGLKRQKSPETIAKMRAAAKMRGGCPPGRKCSPEAVANMRAAQQKRRADRAEAKK